MLFGSCGTISDRRSGMSSTLLYFMYPHGELLAEYSVFCCSVSHPSPSLKYIDMPVRQEPGAPRARWESECRIETKAYCAPSRLAIPRVATDQKSSPFVYRSSRFRGI